MNDIETIVSKINITAKSIDEFNGIVEKLKNVPPHILKQVVSASNELIGTTLVLDKYLVDEKVFLPKGTRQITNFGGYIGCYCPDYFIKLPLYAASKIPTYIIAE